MSEHAARPARNVLILGAHGQIARVATDLFLKQTDAYLRLYLRNARRLRVCLEIT